MTTIYAKAPTRVDLAGGTLDLWPIYAFLGESFTINVAIDIFTYANLTPRTDSKIILNIKDLNKKKSYVSLVACMNDEDPIFSLLRHHIAYWKPKFGFELVTSSESPIGGGLGGSSSLSVSITGAFSKWLGHELTIPDFVRLVSNIEAQVLKVPTGTQDYYPPLLGGLNALKYHHDGCHVESLNYDSELFVTSFLLVYTGRPHRSGFNNWQVLKDCIDGKKKTVQYLEQLRSVSQSLYEVWGEEDWTKLKGLFDKEYKARTQISKVFTSPEIRKLRALSLPLGADAVKICGAGGGGCVLVWCRPGKKEEVSKGCQKKGFKVLPALPVKRGLSVRVE